MIAKKPFRKKDLLIITTIVIILLAGFALVYSHTIHDGTVDRFLGHAGEVRRKTLAELRSIDAGRGERIPTLDEAIQTCREALLGMYIELKTGAAIEAVARVNQTRAEPLKANFSPLLDNLKGCREALFQRAECFRPARVFKNDGLGGSGRRGGAMICGEVGQGRINLVADRGNNGNLRGGDGPRDNLCVKGVEVFHASAAPADDQDIHQAVPVKKGNPFGNFNRGLGALDTRRIEDNPYLSIPFPDNLQDIADSGARGGRHHTDNAGQGGEGLFPLRVKESLRHKLSFELFKGNSLGAAPRWLHPVHNDLEIAARFVKRDSSPANDGHPVFGLKLNEPQLPLEKNGLEHCPVVFQRKVEMPRSSPPRAGDFPLEEDAAKMGLQKAGNLICQFGDSKNFPGCEG